MLRGDPYSSLNPVIGIAVVTYVILRKLLNAHNPFFLTAKADPSVILTDAFQIHVLEVVEEKVDTFSQLPPDLNAWMNFFYYSHLKSEEEMAALIKDNPAVQEAYRQYKQFNQDERLRALDEAHQRFLHDMATDVEEAHDKGKTEGKIEGKIEIARTMKGKGCDVSFIAEITGLSHVEIELL